MINIIFCVRKEYFTYIVIGYFISFSIIVQKINELEAALQKKEEDMKAMEERYKMYLEKARNVSDIMPLIIALFLCLYRLPATLPHLSGSWCISTSVHILSLSHVSTR